MLVASATIMVLVLVMAACGGDDTDNKADNKGAPNADASIPESLQTLIDAAEAEGELSVSGVAIDQLGAFEEAMSEEYGIDVSLDVAGGPGQSEMVTKLIQEHEAGQSPTADVIITSARNRIDMQDAGATAAADWKSYDPTITDEEITRDSSGVVAFGDLVGIAYNTEEFAPEDVPQTLDDLVNPAFEGLIATTPYGSGWAEVGVVYGEDKAREIAEGIAPLIGGFIDSQDFGPIISGQRPIFAFTGDSGVALLEKEKGAPIDITFPFLSYFLYSADVVNGTESPNLAKLFAVFMRSPEAQDIWWEYRRANSPFIEGTNAYSQVQEALDDGKEVLMEDEQVVLDNPEIFQNMRDEIIELIEQG